MPRLIDPGTPTPWDIDDLVAALDAHPFDPRNEDSLADAAPLLARLGANRDFLADLAIAELTGRCAGQVAANAYGAQVFLLRPPTGRYVLRANFWPALHDSAVRASGGAAFFYGHAHDHNFPFVTHGYLGPGYWSDYWERDPDAAIGLPGEPAGLRATGRQRLEPGRLMLYRARQDVHRQLPPDSFSVSLNILAYDPAQPWIEQFRFDVERGTIAEGLTTAPAEGLLALAVQLANGIDVARTIAATHPLARMRVTALDALVQHPDAGGWPLVERAADDPDAYVAGHARQRLAGRDRSGTAAVAA